MQTFVHSQDCVPDPGSKITKKHTLLAVKRMTGTKCDSEDRDQREEGRKVGSGYEKPRRTFWMQYLWAGPRQGRRVCLGRHEDRTLSILVAVAL